METTILYLAIAFFLGILADHLIGKLQKAYGVLKIDRYHSDKELYRFEIDNLDELAKKKFIVLRVDNDADLSQK